MSAISEADLQTFDNMDDAQKKALLAKKSLVGQAAITDAYREWKSKKQTHRDVSMLESGARGAYQGASMRWGDEYAGLMEALGYKLGEMYHDVPENERQKFGDLREKYTNEERAANTAAEEANPGTYTLSEIGGGTAAMLAAPESALATVPRAVATIGASGAVSGIGGSEAPLASKQTIKDAGKGTLSALVGYALGQGIAKGTGYVASKAADKLEPLADKLAAWAGNLGEGARAEEGGRMLLDKGALKATTLLNPFKSPAQGIADNLEPMRMSARKEVSDAVDMVNRIAEEKGITMKKSDVVNFLRNEILPKYKEYSFDRDQAKIIEDEINALAEHSTPAEEGSFKDWVGAKRSAQDKARYKPGQLYEDPVVTRRQESLGEVAGGLRQYTEDSSVKIDPEAGANYKNANKNYTEIASAQEQAQKLADKGGRLPFSSTQFYRHLAKERGASTAAVFVDKLQKALGGSTDARAAAKLLGESPALEKYLPQFFSAYGRSENGEESMQELHDYLMSFDKDYRKAIEGAK